MTEQIPEAWKDQEVEVVYSGPDKTYTEAGILDGLGERGVVLKRAGSDVTRFFPWSSIIYIKHGKDPSFPAYSDSDPTLSETDIVGFGGYTG